MFFFKKIKIKIETKGQAGQEDGQGTGRDGLLSMMISMHILDHPDSRVLAHDLARKIGNTLLIIDGTPSNVKVLLLSAWRSENSGVSKTTTP